MRKLPLAALLLLSGGLLINAASVGCGKTSLDDAPDAGDSNDANGNPNDANTVQQYPFVCQQDALGISRCRATASPAPRPLRPQGRRARRPRTAAASLASRTRPGGRSS